MNRLVEITALCTALFLSLSGHADQVTFLPEPQSALQARLNLIKSAKNDIYFQAYEIANESDPIAKTLLSAIVARAAIATDQIKIHIILDAKNEHLTDAAVQMLQSYPAIELKYFNPGSLADPQFKHRMHNKLLVADNQVAIVGGRNATVDYYDLNQADPRSNFQDIDAMVTGTAAAHLQAYAKTFFEQNPMVKSVSPVTAIQTRPDLSGPLVPDSVLPTAVEVGTVNALFDPPSSALNVSDAQNIAPQIRQILESEFSTTRIAEVDEPSLTIISPYMGLTPEMKTTLQKIKSQVENAGKKFALTVITNSVESTDEMLVQVCFENKSRQDYLDLGASILEYKGTLLETAPSIAKIGHLHQKMLVVNKQKFFVGSFNFDIRSSNINMEIGIFFDASAATDPQLQDSLLTEVQTQLIDRSTLTYDHGRKTSLVPPVTPGQQQEYQKAQGTLTLLSGLICPLT